MKQLMKRIITIPAIAASVLLNSCAQRMPEDVRAFSGIYEGTADDAIQYACYRAAMTNRSISSTTHEKAADFFAQRENRVFPTHDIGSYLNAQTEVYAHLNNRPQNERPYEYGGPAGFVKRIENKMRWNIELDRKIQDLYRANRTLDPNNENLLSAYDSCLKEFNQDF